MTLVATDSSTSTLTQNDPRVKDTAQKFVLTLSCVERAGIVQAVTTFLFERGFNIDEHQQFDDDACGTVSKFVPNNALIVALFLPFWRHKARRMSANSSRSPSLASR